MLTSASLFLVSGVNQFVEAADASYTATATASVLGGVIEERRDEDDGAFELGAKALTPARRLNKAKNVSFRIIVSEKNLK